MNKRKRKILVSKCTIILSIDYIDRVQALANNQIWANQADKKISQTSSLFIQQLKRRRISLQK